MHIHQIKGRDLPDIWFQAVHDILELGERRIFSLFRPDLSLKSFTVVGLFSQQTDLLTNDLLVMNLDDARDLFSLPPSVVTDLCVYVANPAEIETIAKKIALLLPDTRVLTKTQIQKTYQVVFSRICYIDAEICYY